MYRKFIISILMILMSLTFIAPASADTIIPLPIKPKIPPLALSTPDQIWKQYIGTGSIMGPVEGGGPLFIAVSSTNAGNRVYEFDPTTGTKLRQQPLTFNQRITLLSIHDDILIIGTQSNLFAYWINYSPGSYGQLVPYWTLSLGNTIDKPVYDSLGNLYVLSNAEVYSKLTAINRNGKVLWTYRFDDYFASPLAIGLDDIVYAGSLSGKIYAISTQNSITINLPHINKPFTIKIAKPALEWKATIGKATDTIYPIIDPLTKQLYASSTSSGLFAIKWGGSVRWNYPFLNDEVNSAPIAYGTVYVGTSVNGELYAIQENGKLKWKYHAPGNNPQSGIMGTPSMSYTGIMYFGSIDHSAYAVKKDGKGLWKFHTNGAIVIATLRVDHWDYYDDTKNYDLLFIVSTNGYIYCLRDPQ